MLMLRNPRCLYLQVSKLAPKPRANMLACYVVLVKRKEPGSWLYAVGCPSFTAHAMAIGVNPSMRDNYALRAAVKYGGISQVKMLLQDNIVCGNARSIRDCVYIATKQCNSSSPATNLDIVVLLMSKVTLDASDEKRILSLCKKRGGCYDKDIALLVHSCSITNAKADTYSDTDCDYKVVYTDYSIRERW